MEYIVLAYRLNIRKEPSIESEVIGFLEKNEVVDVIDKYSDNYWYKIQVNNSVGWISHKFVKILDKTPPWLVIGKNEIGTKEIPGKDCHNPRILEYLQSTNLGSPYNKRDETHWCSAFVNWCVEKAGYEGTDSARAKDWLKWGEKVQVPRVGSIAVFNRNGGGHVGFYMGENENSIELLGGNQSNEVNISFQKKSNFIEYRDIYNPSNQKNTCTKITNGNFDKCFEKIIILEGGYSDNPSDSGGKTKYGITERVARNYGYQGEMVNLELSYAKKIYKDNYWDNIKLDSILNFDIQMEIFEIGVNCGVNRAVKILQEAYNLLNEKVLNVNGVMDEKTIDFVNGYKKSNRIVALCNALQAEYYLEITRGNQKNEEFIFGWLSKRCFN